MHPTAHHALVTGGTETLGLAVVRRLPRDAVCAGAIRTERTTQAYGRQFEALVRRTPLRRAGTADDVAGRVNLLCEDGAGYITGQCLSIEGGLN